MTRPPPGTFKPARPADSEAVVLLFAMAARASCAQPDNLPAISQTLAQVCSELLGPEREAAEQCARMWQLFAKVAQLPKATLRLEAGRAFCRDLDTLAQRLELPPLAEWVDVPDGINEPQEPAKALPRTQITEATTLPLAQIVAGAQELLAKNPGKHGVEGAAIAALMGQWHPGERATWLDGQVGRGVLGRTDVSLLIRCLAKGGTVHSGDTMLIEVLERLLRALAHP